MSFEIDDFDREGIARGLEEKKKEIVKHSSEFKVICVYCQWEFKQSDKSTSSICKNCAKNTQKYAKKPEKCRYCFMISAFVNGICQRCNDSYRKYGYIKKLFTLFIFPSILFKVITYCFY